MPFEVQRSKHIKSIFVECGKITETPPIRVTCEQLTADDSLLDRHGVRISVRACGLTSQNFSSLQELFKKIQTNRSHSLIANNYPNSQQHEGTVRLSVGQDVAGVVMAVGSEVSSVNIGDEVVGIESKSKTGLLRTLIMSYLLLDPSYVTFLSHDLANYEAFPLLFNSFISSFSGIIPFDSTQSGCSESVVFQEFDLVRKPKQVSFVDAAGCIGDAVKAYTALHYLGRMTSGSTVLVLNGASSFGSLCVQLAYHWGAKVLATSASRDETLYLKSLGPSKVQVVEVGEEEASSLRAACMHETGGLGVDVLVEADYPLPCHSKHDLISCLAIGGCWVTSRSNLQLDPPNSRQLYMRCASLAFLFEQAWLMSSVQQGRYQHVLLDIMEKISSDVIRPNIHHTVSFDEVAEAVLSLEEVKVGKVVMMV